MTPPASLENSRRTIAKVTYTPLVLPDSEDGGGALQLAAAVTDLRLIAGEARAVTGDTRTSASHLARTLAAFEDFASAPDVATHLAAAGALARESTQTLTRAVALVRAAREHALTEMLAGFTSTTRLYLAAVKAQGPAAPGVSAPGNRFAFIEDATARTGLLPTQANAAQVSEQRSSLATGVSGSAIGSLAAGAASTAQVPPLPPAVVARLGGEIAASAGAAVDWARTNAPELVAQLLNGAAVVLPSAQRQSIGALLYDGLPFLIEQVQRTVSVAGHLTQRNLQPIGLLHLEQVAITPLQVERGELVYSLPLAPLERVTLAHKEWTLREEEYSRFVQDRLEYYSERGVAEQNELASASRSENEHSKTLSMSKPVVPGAATIADPVDTQTTTDVTKETQSQERSSRDTRAITEQASSLAVRDQKVSFTVTTVAGTQDFTAQLFENKHTDKVMLIEYFRRMRKWRNQLCRTGIRLTYDVVLPDPGRRLRERWMELQALEDQINAPFALDIAPSPYDAVLPLRSGFAVVGTGGAASLFGSSPSTADAAYLEGLARAFGVTIQPAPLASLTVEEQHAVTDAPPDKPFAFALTVPVPDDYQVERMWMGGRVAATGDGDVMIVGEFRNQRVDIASDGIFHSVELNVSNQIPNKPVIAFIAFKGAIGSVRAWAEVSVTGGGWRKWRATAVSAIRQAAYARYNETRERLRQRRVALLRELEAPDTLTLRRIEREQIMRLVLEWLFPDFVQGAQVYKESATHKPEGWEPAMEYGEYIKFVHQAVDWDNALVLLYPYFWDHPDKHAVKLFLDHPDGGHREFLRAGAARVILAMTPGFESQVISLLDKGQLGEIANSSRFQSVIDQVQVAHSRFAELVHGQLAPGGDDEGDALPEDEDLAAVPRRAVPGVRIAEWVEWTPTSALDMETRIRPVVVEP
jgi:hypothetical protein